MLITTVPCLSIFSDYNTSKKVKCQKNTKIQGKFKMESPLVIKWKNQKLKFIKQTDNNFELPDLVKTLPYVKKMVDKTWFSR